jgi:NitT/TauT family transport system substrate-binding protein
MSRKAWIIAYAVIALLAIGIGVALFTPSKPPPQVRIGYLPISGSLPAYVAVEREHLSRFGLKPRLISFNSSNAIMTALLAGEIEVAACPSAVDVLACASKFPGKMRIFRVGYTTRKDNEYVSALIVRKDAPYHSLRDLAGKKIGILLGVGQEMYARLLFQKVLGNQSRIELVPMAPQLHLQALASGTVDACLALEPTGIIGEQKQISRYLERGVVEKYVSDPWIAGFSVISQAYIEARPREAMNCVKAFNLAVDELRKDPASGAELLSKYNSLDREVARRVPVPISYKADEFAKVTEPLSELSTLLRQQKILDQDVAVEALLYRP